MSVVASFPLAPPPPPPPPGGCGGGDDGKRPLDKDELYRIENDEKTAQAKKRSRKDETSNEENDGAKKKMKANNDKKDDNVYNPDRLNHITKFPPRSLDGKCELTVPHDPKNEATTVWKRDPLNPDYFKHGQLKNGKKEKDASLSKAHRFDGKWHKCSYKGCNFTKECSKDFTGRHHGKEWHGFPSGSGRGSDSFRELNSQYLKDAILISPAEAKEANKKWAALRKQTKGGPMLPNGTPNNDYQRTPEGEAIRNADPPTDALNALLIGTRAATTTGTAPFAPATRSSTRTTTTTTTPAVAAPPATNPPVATNPVAANPPVALAAPAVATNLPVAPVALNVPAPAAPRVRAPPPPPTVDPRLVEPEVEMEDEEEDSPPPARAPGACWRESEGGAANRGRQGFCACEPSGVNCSKMQF